MPMYHFWVSVNLFIFFYFTDLESREKDDSHSVHIFNIDIQDNHEEATIGAFIIRDLVTTVTGLYSYFLPSIPPGKSTLWKKTILIKQNLPNFILRMNPKLSETENSRSTKKCQNFNLRFYRIQCS